MNKLNNTENNLFSCESRKLHENIHNQMEKIGINLLNKSIK